MTPLHAHAPWDDHDPECCDHTDVTNGMCGDCGDCGDQAGPITVTVTLAGLPPHCPRCGAPAPDGQWGIGVHGNLLHVVCPLCFTAITPVRAVAAEETGQ